MQPLETPRKAGAARPLGPTVMLTVWPEYGHVVTPLALAKQLREHGYRVVFAGARTFEKAMTALGYEYASLSVPRAVGEPTLFDFLPDRAAFLAAVEHFISTFQAALATYRPSVILLDSLYSAFGTLASAARIPWAIYETDLPREYDAGAPPPHLLEVPSAQSAARIEQEWILSLDRVGVTRHGARGAPDLAYSWATAHFPPLLTEELQARLQTEVRFDYRTLYAPLARAPRLVFCPAELDFDRTGRDGISWVGPYLDYERKEPDFPWAALPQDRRIAYCALGTQSSRHANTVQVLQTVIDGFSARDDYFLVMACSAHQQAALRNVPAHVLLVEKAPQLALLRKAQLAVTHAGFNSLKECAALGVPMVALPLGLDQPRNAALVQLRGLGAALDVETLTVARLNAAISTVSRSAPVKAACARMKAISESYARKPLGLQFVADLLRGKRQRKPRSQLDRGTTWTSTT